MKYKLNQLFLTLVSGISILCLVPAETLNLCSASGPHDYFPTPLEPKRPVVIDMLTDIYTAAGYELKFWEVPYARGMEMVAQGHCGSLPEKEFSSVAERDVVYATQPTFIYPTGFSVRAGDPWRYQGKPVATGQGWNYSSMSVAYQNDLDDPKNEQDIEMVAGHGKVVKRILHMIVAERVDLYADNLFVLQYVIDLAGLNEQIEIVTAELDNRLISELIFSGTFPRAKPNTLINIWDNGRQAIDKPQEKTYLQNYGITLW